MRCRSLWIAGAALITMLSAGTRMDAAGDSHYSRWPRVRLAGFSVGVGVAGVGTPWRAYPWGYGYGAGLYGPWGWGGGGFLETTPAASFYGLSLGQLKLKDLDRSAAIFLDGGYAGTAGELKSMWIEPGTHQLKVTEGGRTFEEKIYVLTGKTMTLNPEMTVDGGRQ